MVVDIFVIWILDGLGLCVAVDVDVELEIDDDLSDKARFNTDDAEVKRRLDGVLIVCERPEDES